MPESIVGRYQKYSATIEAINCSGKVLVLLFFRSKVTRSRFFLYSCDIPSGYCIPLPPNAVNDYCGLFSINIVYKIGYRYSKLYSKCVNVGVIY